MRHARSGFRMKWAVGAVGLAAAIGLVATAGLAQGPGKSAGAKIGIGELMPDFTMTDHAGKEHALSKSKGYIVLLSFSSQECPYSRGVDPDLAQVAKDYKDKGVVVLSIDSHKTTQPDAIRQYAEKNKLPFPILKDHRNAYADKVGATRTPEIFVLDRDLKLAYHGAFDDRQNPSKTGETSYVRGALDSLLAERDVAPSRVKTWGCTIKRVPVAAASAPKPARTPREGS